MRILVVITTLLAGVSHGHATPKPVRPAPVTLHQAIDMAIAAWTSQDREILRSLAEGDAPDPWLIAEGLCYRGQPDAAAALARATTRTDTERLPGFVESRREQASNEAARTALTAANRALDRNDHDAALTILEKIETAPGDLVSVLVWEARGWALLSLRRFQESTRAYRASGAAALNIGWIRRAAYAYDMAGLAGYDRADFKGARADWDRRLSLEQARGDALGEAGALFNLGLVHRVLGDLSQALVCLQRARELREARGDAAGAAGALQNIGNVHFDRSEYEQALACYQHNLDFHARSGSATGVAQALGGLGNVQRRRGAYDGALDAFRGALRLAEKLENRAMVAKALGGLGEVHDELGSYAKAVSLHGRSLRLAEKLGLVEPTLAALNNLGSAHSSLGNYAEALEVLHRAVALAQKVGYRNAAAGTLGNLGNVYGRIGNHEKSRDCNSRALRISDELGDRDNIALGLHNRGAYLLSQGDREEALKAFTRAAKLRREIGNLAGLASTLEAIGSIHSWQERPGEAFAALREALGISKELQHRERIAETLQALGFAHFNLGEYVKSIEFQHSALVRAREIDHLDIEILALAGLAEAHLKTGDASRAIEFAGRAVDRLPLLAGGLSQEGGAQLRRRHAKPFEYGARAALRLESVAQAVHFVESGRAATLLEALGGREKLQATGLPDALMREEVAARIAEAQARKLHRRALDRGDREEVRRLRADFDRARATREEVIAKIQRKSKKAASVLYPRADSVKDIQGALQAGDALVLYALHEVEPFALVLTRSEARIARLESPAEIAPAWGALKDTISKPPRSGRALDDAVVTRLRHLVVEPLALPKNVKRLVVSPHGAVADLPLAVLARDLEVVYVPSGTTYRLLARDGELRGEDVLGLGDVDYATTRKGTTLGVYRSGDLVQLPGTRIEVNAVADVKLLGGAASEAGLHAAVRQRPRWRAVHFACHGRLDHERPMLSSLALSPDPANDGFLTTLEVFRMRIPADLVVLSACESGKGKVYAAEGIVGFARAFLFAGAPRVIVSLWNVDDQATRALMVRFYRLWNPRDGNKGLPPATALKRAQEFVASHAKWQHPFFWAAWQLWGLGE